MARRRYSSYYSYGFFRQPTVREMESSANEALRQAKAKGLDYHPVRGNGRKICKSWWGNAWCDNLAQYADYGNRLPRGKRYINYGSVLDLRADVGVISGIVQGSSQYRIRIEVAALPKKRIDELIRRCTSRFENIDDLNKGVFPKDLQDLFSLRGGLFPTPKELKFACSCPDIAVMCKHVAAVLYGFGVLLDTDPMLFFKVRGVDVDQFLDASVRSKIDSMLANAKNDSARIVRDQDLGDLFGVL